VIINLGKYLPYEILSHERQIPQGIEVMLVACDALTKFHHLTRFYQSPETKDGVGNARN
jgi:hypothetical protein